MSRKIVLFFCLILCLATTVFARDINWQERGINRFERIEVDRLLSHQQVVSLYRDSEGFLWIGTYMALFRYNGYQTERFYAEPRAGAIGNHVVHEMYEDSSGNFWMGTEGGLALYDKGNMTFSTCNPEGKQIHIRSIVENRDGCLWLGTYNDGLYFFNPANKSFTKYRFFENNGKEMPLAINEVLLDSKGYLWIGSEQNGLFRLNLKNNKYAHYYSKSEGPISRRTIMAIVESPDGLIWIGSWHRGIVVYDYETDNFRNYAVEMGYKGEYSFPVMDIVADKKNNSFWIATKDNGLFKVDLSTKEFTPFPLFNEAGDAISYENLWKILYDYNNILWVGFRGNGVYKYDARENRFPFFKIDYKEDISRYCSFVEINDEEIWVGTDVGLYKYNTKTKGYKKYISNEIISLIEKDVEDSYWVVSNLFVYYYDKKSDSFRKVVDLTRKEVIEFECDSKGNLWISVYANGVYLLDSSKRKTNTVYTPLDLIHYFSESKDIHSLSSNTVWSIFEDSENQMWFGSENGLDLRKDNIGGFENVYKGRVNSIKQTEEHFLWLGSFIEGIKYYDIDKKSLTDIENTYTYDGRAMTAFEIEQNGKNIWYAKGDELFRIHIETKEKKGYRAAYGLQNSDFVIKSSTMLSSGALLFGGNSGFNIFNSDSIYLDSIIPPLQINEFKLYNRISDSTSHFHGKVNTSNTYTLQVDENMFSIRYSAIEYSFQHELEYYYKMENTDKNWVLGQDRFVTYVNMPPGNYTFKLKVKNEDGFWSEEYNSMQIKIKPSFFQTMYFYLILLVLWFLIVYILVWQKRKKEAERKKEKYLQELKHEVEYRNKELVALLIKDANRKEKLQEIKKVLASSMGKVSSSLSVTFKKLIETINRDEVDTENWNQFELYFNQANNNFLKRIKGEFPDLTLTELKICAFIRINLQNGEIADMMNLTGRTIEANRYRIRKKLNLTPDVSLSAFISNY